MHPADLFLKTSGLASFVDLCLLGKFCGSSSSSWQVLWMCPNLCSIASQAPPPQATTATAGQGRDKTSPNMIEVRITGLQTKIQF